MRRDGGRRCIGWDLDWPERLFITAVRVWLQGASARADFFVTLRHNLGARGACAAEALDGFLEILVCGARRVLWFRHCDGGRPTADERALVALMAAVQHREDDRVEAALRWLLPCRLRPQALSHAREFATAMSENGLRLSVLPQRLPPHRTAPAVVAGETAVPIDAERRSRRAPPSRA